jgi:transcriptional regulator with XRE-family HTH domain
MAVDPTTPELSTRRRRGDALKQARTTAGLSAMGLADRVNQRTAGSDLTHHAIYSYERGKVLLSREVGLRIAQTLNLHPGELLRGDPDFETPSNTAHDPAAAEFAIGSAGANDAAVGLSLDQRIQLSKAARVVLPAGNLLYRLLDTAQIGRSSVAGYLDVFHLLLRDLQAVLDSPAGRDVRAHGLDEGNDAPHQLVQACTRLLRDTEKGLRDLVEDAGRSTTAHYDAVVAFRSALAGGLRKLEADLRLHDRGLDPDAPPPTNLLPQLPVGGDGSD